MSIEYNERILLENYVGHVIKYVFQYLLYFEFITDKIIEASEEGLGKNVISILRISSTYVIPQNTRIGFDVMIEFFNFIIISYLIVLTVFK